MNSSRSVFKNLKYLTKYLFGLIISYSIRLKPIKYKNGS